MEGTALLLLPDSVTTVLVRRILSLFLQAVTVGNCRSGRLCLTQVYNHEVLHSFKAQMLAIPDNSIFPSWFCSCLSAYVSDVKPWGLRKEIEHPAWQLEKL